MADVRSLLRQQRAARRIEHPNAAYSDSGKLLCTVCHEAIKTETLWEGHVASEGHRKKLQRLQTVPKVNGQATEDGAAAGAKQKRKLDDDEDVEMDDGARRKRNKAEVTTPTLETEGDKEPKDQISTPPQLARRTSQTPSHGVELRIPSRPATPGTQPLTTTLPRRASALNQEDRPTFPPSVDESEWAAFEADIAAASVPYDADAVISAPAMTAEESAAAIQAEEDAAEKRRAQADVDLEDEKEEAARALEEEFDEMEELEARVKRLKDQREALRKRSGSFGQEAVPSKPLPAENERTKETIVEEDEEEDDEDDEDDWDGFRFRAN